MMRNDHAAVEARNGHGPMHPELPPPLALRPAGPADAAWLERIYGSMRAGELARTDWSESMKSRFIRMQFRAQDTHYRRHYPGAEYLLLLWDGSVAGRLYLHARESDLRIMDLGLLPEYRNQGIGTRVLLALQALAKGSNMGLTIHVERFNPAARLYRRLGFAIRQAGDVYDLLEWGRAEP